MKDRLKDNTAIHTAARRFLMDRHAELKSLHDEIGRWGTQSDELLLYPRMSLLDAMLAAVEALVPTSEDETTFRMQVAEAGRTAEDWITQCKNWREQNTWEKTRDERERFADAVQSWTDEYLSHLELLPFRRTVLAEERAALWERLQDRWKVGEDKWLPWTNARPEEEVLVVDAAALRENVGDEVLRGILHEGGVSYVLVLGEQGEKQDYELLLEQFEPWKGSGERFLFSEAVDWIIYTTHEGSAALGGNSLLSAVKALWPSWAEHPFLPSHYVPPPQKPSADLPAPMDFGRRLHLLAASGSGDLEKIAALLDAGTDVNIGWPRSGTVLHTAAVRGQVSSVRLLLARGANINAATPVGITPLMEAVSGGHIGAVQALLEAGADRNARAGASDHDKRAGLTAREIAMASPYLKALGDRQRDEIISLLEEP